MDLVLLTAKSCLNIPYIFGGNSPLQGLDCSGFVQWVLKSAGMDPPGDQTAQALFDYFEKNGSFGVEKPGSLVFYGKTVAAISHVALMLDRFRVIEAGGGDSTTKTRADAEKRGACVRIRHISDRKDLVAKIYPNYSKIGLI